MTFVRLLNTPGGRISVLVFVLILGLAADRAGVNYAKEMVIGTLTTMLTIIARER